MSLKTVTDKMSALREEIQKFGKKELAAEFQTFWAAHPDVEAVRWTQYTPHFNDGSPCTFGLQDFFVKMKNVEYTADEQQEWDDGYGPYQGTDSSKAVKAAQRDLERFQTAAATEVFKAVFGDGSMVTATPKGFKVEECDHD